MAVIASGVTAGVAGSVGVSMDVLALEITVGLVVDIMPNGTEAEGDTIPTIG